MVGVSFSVTVKHPLRIFVPPAASHGRPPSQRATFTLLSPPLDGACPRARHVGLQLEEIRGSGDGRGVFLALGMF